MSNTIALLPEETIVTSLDKDNLTLTTKRVRYNSVVWGNSNLISITLQSIASCGLVTKSWPVLLIFALLAFLVSLSLLGSSEFVMPLIAAVVLLGIYFFTRRSVISIASNGGEVILVPIKRMKREDIISFIEAVEREKLNRS